MPGPLNEDGDIIPRGQTHNGRRKTYFQHKLTKLLILLQENVEQ